MKTIIHADDRGILADLRQGFSPGTEHRAWPHIARFCDLARDKDRKIFLTIAAGFALHKRTVVGGNMGWTMRHIALGEDSHSFSKALASFESRFRRLITCSSAEEVCSHLKRCHQGSRAKRRSNRL